MDILQDTDWGQLWIEQRAHFKATIYDNPYIPEAPFVNQIRFLIYPSEELLYGGAAGGGKSSALLMSALQYVTEPDYAALLLRRTYQDLSQPGAILDRAKRWLKPFLKNGEVKYNNTTKTFVFPTGSTLSFGYLSHDNDLDQYQGSELQFVGFDELTQFTERQYTYLHSRLRKLESSNIPLRIRAGSNPGGRSHDFVKKRFVRGNIPFIPSSYKDNKYLNIREYSKSLDKLDEVTRLQLKFGDWDAELSVGLLLSREHLRNALISQEEYKDWTPSLNILGVDKASTGADNFAVVSLTSFTNNKLVVTGLLSTSSAYPEELVKQFLYEQYSQYNTYLVNFEAEPGSDSAYALRHWQLILEPVTRQYGILVQDTKAVHSKFNRARPIALRIKEGELFFDDRLDLKNLFNQFMYIHPDKQVMKNYPSPDELDALGYAFAPLKELENAYVTPQ